MFYKCCLPGGILAQKHDHGFGIKITISLHILKEQAEFHFPRCYIVYKCCNSLTKKNELKQSPTTDISSLTSTGDAKSLKRYVTSKGFSFSAYNLFKPSTIVTTLTWGCTWKNFSLLVRPHDPIIKRLALTAINQVVSNLYNSFWFEPGSFCRYSLWLSNYCKFSEQTNNFHITKTKNSHEWEYCKKRTMLFYHCLHHLHMLLMLSASVSKHVMIIIP